MFPSVSCPAVCVFLCVDLMRRYSYLYHSTSCWFCRGGGYNCVVGCLSVCVFVCEWVRCISVPTLPLYFQLVRVFSVCVKLSVCLSVLLPLPLCFPLLLSGGLTFLSPRYIARLSSARARFSSEDSRGGLVYPTYSFIKAVVVSNLSGTLLSFGKIRSFAKETNIVSSLFSDMSDVTSPWRLFTTIELSSVASLEPSDVIGISRPGDFSFEEEDPIFSLCYYKKRG